MIRPYRVTIEGPGIVSIKWRASWDQVQRMQELLADDSASDEVARRARGEARARLRDDLRAFLTECNARNNYQRIAALALFIEDRPGTDGGLRREEISEWFVRAWMNPPANPSRDLQRAISRGLVTEDRERQGSILPTARARRDLGPGASQNSGKVSEGKN